MNTAAGNPLKSVTAEQVGLNVKNAWYVLKNSWFMPESPYSFFVFCVLMILIFTLIIFFHYNNIQRQVKKYSRCYKNKMKTATSSGIYTVTATTGRADQKLYNVTYDLKMKKTTLECACPQSEDATNVNTFRDIPIYNLQTKTVDTVDTKYCQCNFQADTPSTSVYYTGHPGLVRFMNSGDESFFTG